MELESELRLGTPDPDEMKRIESLVQEFFCGPSENRNMLGGGGSGMSALERWFSELGVSWVLQLDVGASAWVHGHPMIDEICSWTKALQKIMETIRLMEPFLCREHGHGFVGMPGISEEEEVDSGKEDTTSIREEEVEHEKQDATSLDPAVQLALFFQKAMSKALVFVDVMFSESLPIGGPPYISYPLVSYLNVHCALSKALSRIRLQFHSSPPAKVEKIEMEMVSLLSAKQGKAFEATWSTLEETMNHIAKSVEEYSSGTQTPQGSTNIHDTTYLLMADIILLLRNHSTVSPLVSEAASLGKYVPQTGHGEAPPFISLIMEMVSYLQQKLITLSQLYLDKGLMFLFLLNNSNFIWERLKYNSYIKVDVAAISSKVEHYIESYILVSWAPMLSLFNPTPLCFRRKYSPFSKFESEFQKTYTTQKLWKVPDPELRKRLRKAVMEKIIPGYTKYIKDSKAINPKFTPQELEEMLQGLFEG